MPSSRSSSVATRAKASTGGDGDEVKPKKKAAPKKKKKTTSAKKMEEPAAKKMEEPAAKKEEEPAAKKEEEPAFVEPIAELTEEKKKDEQVILDLTMDA